MRKLSINVVVIEDIKELNVPLDFQSLITVEKENFLTYHTNRGCEFYDVVYSAVCGSACDIFTWKYLCHCFFACMKNCLVIAHPYVFEARASEDNDKPATKILSAHVRNQVNGTGSPRVSLLQSSNSQVWGQGSWPKFGLKVCAVSHSFISFFVCVCLIFIIL
jgi:hypothetical protein